YTSFSFKIQDDGGIANSGADTSTAAATETVNVRSVNDTPTAVSGSVTTNEDTDYTFAGTDFNFTDSNDSPAPNGLAAVIVTSLPGNGSLLYNSTALTAGNLPKTVTAADPAANKLVSLPLHDALPISYTSFSFKIQDDGGIANSGADTSTAAATETVNV